MKKIALYLTMIFFSITAQAEEAAIVLDKDITDRSFIALNVGDIKAETAWFQKVFQVKILKEVTIPDGKGFVVLMGSDKLAIELLQLTGSAVPTATSPVRIRGHVKNGIFVQNLEERFTQLKNAGIYMHGRLYTDEPMGMKGFLIKDPEGNILQFFEMLAPPSP